MMPNIDPRTLKSMMDKMGIKSREISAIRVTIESEDKDIIIENPQVISIEAQGALSFQVSGRVVERERKQEIEISEDDVKLVSEQTGVKDSELIRKTLQETKGDIAETIVRLRG